MYSSPFLSGRSDLEIAAAIETIERRRTGWTVDALSEAVAEYIEENERRAAYLALPRHNGYTEQEWDLIMGTLRALYEERCCGCGRLMRPPVDQSEARELLAAKDRVIETLLEYISAM